MKQKELKHIQILYDSERENFFQLKPLMGHSFVRNVTKRDALAA
jgi:hypothetical protein